MKGELHPSKNHSPCAYFLAHGSREDGGGGGDFCFEKKRPAGMGAALDPLKTRRR